MIFTYVKDSQIDQAYSILCNRIDELIIKKTGQYNSYFPNKEEFIQRNRNKENWCLTVNSKMVGIVSLSQNKIPDYWIDQISDCSYYWLASLFVAPDHKGNNYGKVIMKKCKEKAEEENINNIYLDCYMDSGYLVPFYEKQGFIKIHEKEFKYNDRVLNAALMMFTV